ncbi:MAG TPA: DUF2062 domain-containing protein [Gammaproteobacteria bacterium]|nr:DUF2062 domain-containing protein [Gammaproteobacteria bacterium]
MRKILTKRLIPYSRSIRRDHNMRRLFGRLMHSPNLWHLNRHSVAWGVSIGLFMAFVPVPFQMLLAVAAAIALNANLPVSVVVVWISNPITVAPLFYSAYKVGALLLGTQPKSIRFEISLEWLMTRLVDVWEPFLLGCFVLAVSSALLGHIAVKIIWRIHVVQSWRMRHRRALDRIAESRAKKAAAEKMVGRSERAK